VPPEVEAAIDKRSSMAAVGNLNDFVKYQMAKGMEQPGGGGAAGMASELAVGFAIAQQMMAQQGQATRPVPGGAPAVAPAVPPPIPTAPAAPPAAAAGPVDLLSPAEVAQILGVTEADVLSVIGSGELKAKQIGASYRIKRSALDEYLAQ
jgi:excisionase family DNA binding protein